MYRDSTTQRRNCDMKTRNIYILITIVITSWALGACASDRAATKPSEKVTPEIANKAIADSEILFKQREDLDKLRAAIKMVAAVRDPDNRNYQIEWTFAKYNYFLGKFTPDADEAEESLEAGRDSAKIASRVEPQKPEGHFWYAANLGEMAKQ